MGLDARNPGIASKFVESTNKTLSSHPEAASALLSAYNITPSTSDDEAVVSILRFATDISFYAPALAFAKGWPQTKDNKIFLYHFNEGNPWEGRFKGEAGHILDVSYLFQNFNLLVIQGHMTLILIPSGVAVKCNPLINPTTPCLLAVYVASPPLSLNPAMLLTNTKSPPALFFLR